MAKRISKSLQPLLWVLHRCLKFLPIKNASEIMAFLLTRSDRAFLKTKNIKANIRDAFPDLDECEVESLKNKMIANFGRHVAEIIHIPTFRDGRKGTSISVCTPRRSSIESQGPAIYVGAHVGSWELFPLVFKDQAFPLTVIYTQNINPIVDTLLQPLRQQTGAQYVEKSKALRACFTALEKGGSVALLVDQRVAPGIDVNFFGRPTAITRLPARLAIKCNCPIVPFEVIRSSPGQLRAVFQDPILPDGKKSELDLTKKMAKSVQDSITRNAETWFCSKRRWNDADKAGSNSHGVRTVNVGATSHRQV